MSTYDGFDIPMLTRKAASQRLLGTVVMLHNCVLKVTYLMSKLPCPEYADTCELRIVAL